MIQYFKDNGGVLRYGEIKKEGFTQNQIYKLHKEGKIEKIQNGIYKLKDFELNSLDISKFFVQTMCTKEEGKACGICGG